MTGDGPPRGVTGASRPACPAVDRRTDVGRDKGEAIADGNQRVRAARLGVDVLLGVVVAGGAD